MSISKAFMDSAGEILPSRGRDGALRAVLPQETMDAFLSDDGHRLLSLSMMASATEAAPDDVMTFAGQTSPVFQKQMLGEWRCVPEAFKQHLRAGGFRIALAQTGAEAAPHMRETPLRAGEDETRNHVNQAGGFFEPASFKTSVAEFKLNPLAMDSKTSPLGVRGIAQNLWARGTNTGSLRHEVAHAVDCLVEKYTGIPLRNTPAFQEAYDADLKALGGENSARSKGYKYYVRAQKTRGRGETAAELMNLVWGDAPASEGMLRDWPRSASEIRDFNRGFIVAHTAGTGSLMKFLARRTGTDILSKPLLASWTRLLRNQPSLAPRDLAEWTEGLDGRHAAALRRSLEKVAQRQPKANDGVMLDALDRRLALEATQGENAPDRASVRSMTKPTAPTKRL